MKIHQPSQAWFPSRREVLSRASNGFGMLALASLLGRQAQADQSPGTQSSLRPTPHFQPKAKRVIFCFMDGGPSHVDTFDYKPSLARFENKPIGADGVSKLSQSSASRVWFGSPWRFAQRGKSGLWCSDLFPYFANIMDELCVVRSIVGKQPLHGQQALLLHTGRVTGQAPSVGSWISYGLGTENENLPGYVLLNNDWIPNGGYENFASAFLPANHGATMLRAKGIPVDNIQAADKLALQRRKLDLIRQQDQKFSDRTKETELIESAIQNYETAFQMQAAIPELADVSRETQQTQQMYGLDSKNEYKHYYALQCLRARRLVEAGVRFIEITCPLTHANNSPWDQHGNIRKYHEENAMITEQSVAALIVDLKQRGLLDETIVLWAGEMGRTPHTPAINATCGRDHHVNGYSVFMAGGGFKPGTVYGTTDEFGNTVAENPVTIHDIHATILHLMGVDHERQVFRFGGRDVSLTDVHGRVIDEILA